MIERDPRCDRSPPPSRHRRRRRPAIAVRADPRRCGGVRRVHLRLCRRAHHPLPAAALLQTPRDGNLLRRRRRRAGGRHRRARVRGRIRLPCARLLRSGRAGGRMRRPRQGERAAGPARRNGAHLQPPPLPRPSLPHDHAQGRGGARKASRGKGEAPERPLDREPLPERLVHPWRPAPRPRPRAVARRRAREPAGRVLGVCREARELRESSRPVDHHRFAPAESGVRPGRDGARGESLRRRP